jgi:dienelactone hydrolase
MTGRPEDPPGASPPERGHPDGDFSRAPTEAPSPGTKPTPPVPSSSISGITVGHFEVLDLVGAGGFGEVYRARDTRLGRMVAIKVLPAAFALDAERRERFHREALAASALNHPNICTVYELFESGEKTFIVMELVEGRTLHAALASGPLPAAEAVPIALQIADALAEAHRAGILHRDVKSGNIVVTPRGQVKVLDFGLAKRIGPETGSGDSTPQALTRSGTTLGTLSYMSPEQLLGKAVDRRSDLFSFGVVLFEMVTGRLPFEGSTAIAVADAILHAEPRDFGGRPVPEALRAIIRRLLEKDPERRFANAEDVHAALKTLQASLAPARPGGLSRSTRIAVGVALAGVLALAGWLLHRASRVRWALETATPEIVRRVEAQEFPKAAALIREARAILPKDPTLEKLWMTSTREVSLRSNPAGADVSVRPYRADVKAWETVGKTPLEKVRLPVDVYFWRIAKAGFAPLEFIGRGPFSDLAFRLEPESGVPAGMAPVAVPGGEANLSIPGLDHHPDVKLDGYLIDRTEVTNEEYRKFVDAGGYQKRELWKQPFVRDGRALPFEEAVALFRDTTGRPGPATWEVGSFPKGMEKHPVAGVSWYEAAAYAEFAGKSLPTIYHWNWAAQTSFSYLVAPGSNLLGAGTLPVGGAGALGGFGTFDMAGNVKEWCWNETSEGKRYILGGGFGEPIYLFMWVDAQSPWDRRPNYGIRCVKVPASQAPAAAGRIERAFRDYSKEKPASEESFRAYKGLYAYDRRDLNARVDATETSDDWTLESVSFDAAYGDERVIAYLYLPRNARPPYQTVVYFPGSNVIFTDKLQGTYTTYYNFLPKAGRAVLFPVYKGTFERRDGLETTAPEPTAFYRDHVIAWSKDLGRSIDYLETRKDLDREKLAYLGFSWGGAIGPVLLAVEDRFKAAVLLVGGFKFQRPLPEVDSLNFASRVRVPVLMLNGRYDNSFPVESSQIPLFRLLGTPEKDKKHLLYDSGHAPPLRDYMRESLDWLDKYLGPVRK